AVFHRGRRTDRARLDRSAANGSYASDLARQRQLPCGICVEDRRRARRGTALAFSDGVTLGLLVPLALWTRSLVPQGIRCDRGISTVGARCAGAHLLWLLRDAARRFRRSDRLARNGAACIRGNGRGARPRARDDSLGACGTLRREQRCSGPVTTYS